MTQVGQQHLSSDTARGKVVWHVTMSLDGFIAGPDDALDWVFGPGQFRDGTGAVGEAE
jgi:hypothetical protein